MGHVTGKAMKAQDGGGRHLWRVYVTFITPWSEEVVWFEFPSCTVVPKKGTCLFPCFLQASTAGQETFPVATNRRWLCFFLMSVLCSYPLGYS